MMAQSFIDRAARCAQTTGQTGRRNKGASGPIRIGRSARTATPGTDSSRSPPFARLEGKSPALQRGSSSWKNFSRCQRLVPRLRLRSAQQPELDDRGGAERPRLRRFEDCRERLKALPRTLERIENLSISAGCWRRKIPLYLFNDLD